MAKKDYPELEGLELTYYNGSKEYAAVVIGCNYDIGITIMTEDKKKYLSCMQGPSSPQYSPNAVDAKNYSAQFYSYIRRIKTRYFDVNESEAMTRKIINSKSVFNTLGPDSSSCPFS